MTPITPNRIITKAREAAEFAPGEIEANIEETNEKTYINTPITGKITAIKLAVVPSFLPDSSDMLTLSNVICGGLGISFSQAQNQTFTH